MMNEEERKIAKTMSDYPRAMSRGKTMRLPLHISAAMPPGKRADISTAGTRAIGKASSTCSNTSTSCRKNCVTTALPSVVPNLAGSLAKNTLPAILNRPALSLPPRPPRPTLPICLPANSTDLPAVICLTRGIAPISTPPKRPVPLVTRHAGIAIPDAHTSPARPAPPAAPPAAAAETPARSSPPRLAACGGRPQLISGSLHALPPVRPHPPVLPHKPVLDPSLHPSRPLCTRIVPRPAAGNHGRNRELHPLFAKIHTQNCNRQEATPYATDL